MNWQPDFWHWWILGVALMALEALLPGTFFLWMGVAAGFVGVLLLVLPGLAIEYQLLAFAVVSVGSIVFWQLHLRHHPPRSDQPVLNQRGRQYVGRVFTLEEPIRDGTGWLRVDDTRWRIEGPDLEAGTRVRVIGVNGASLRVEAAD